MKLVGRTALSVLTSTKVAHAVAHGGFGAHGGAPYVVAHNQGIAIYLLKTLAEHRSIQTTAAYLYSSPNLLKAAVELA